MRIDRLRLKNFKGYEDNQFQFPSRFNLIIGKNGSGKTALLDALAIAAGTLFLKFNGTSTRSIFKEEILLKRHEFSDTEWRVEPQFPVEVEARGCVSGKELNWKRTIQAESGKTTYKNAGKMLALSKSLQEKVMNGENAPLPLIGYYGTGRLWLQKQAKSTDIGELDSRINGYLDCLDPASNEKLFLQWYKRMDYIAYQQKSQGGPPPVMLEAVKRAVSKAVAGCEALIFNAAELQLKARFEDGRELPLQNFSDGERNMIGMVADIAYRMAVLNPFFGEHVIEETEGLVLIDEIDLHLHPEWQRTVVQDLKRTFPKVQFIATTHSPFIIQSLSPSEDTILSLSPSPGFPRHNVDTMGVEEVAEEWQQVEQPQRSKRYWDQIDAAEVYFKVIEEAKVAQGEERAQLIEKLSILMKDMERFGDDPAYQAALRLERHAAGLE